jgi:ATP-dependent DNA ligase
VVFANACELGLEGIVSKRAGSFYRSGEAAIG